MESQSEEGGRRYLLREPAPRENFVDGRKRAQSDGRKDPIVIDMGSYEVRAGFASSVDPVMRYPPVVSRARDTGPDGRRRNFVGYEALQTSVRSQAKSPFELNVPFNAPLVERLLDGTVSLLGLSDDEQINRPFVLTEPVCQLNAVRAPVMEVLFEGYRAESVCLGVDAIFSYLYNSSKAANNGRLSSPFHCPDALLLSSSFRTTHILPLVNGRLYAAAAKRINVGGDQATHSLAQRLRLLHPIFAPTFSYDRVNLLKENVCYYSLNYGEELDRLRTDADYFDKIETVVEIPKEDAVKTGPSPEEVERQRQLRVENGKRLREMMLNRKVENNSVHGRADVSNGGSVLHTPGGDGRNKASADDKLGTEDTERVESVLQNRSDIQAIFDIKVYEDEYFLAMARNGYKQKRDMEVAFEATTSQLDALKEELGEERVEKAEALWHKRQLEDALLATPDSMLTPAHLKDKRRVKSTRGAAEARERIRQQKEEEKLKFAEAEAEAIRKKEEDPQGYLESKLRRREELTQKIKRRNAAREAGSDRRSQASRNRMRLLAQQIMPEGKKGVDTFGANDSDWKVYNDIQGGDSDEEAEDEALLSSINEEVAQLAPHLVEDETAEAKGSQKLYYPIERFNEIDLCIDRIRTTEVIWQPSIIGLDQCGVQETFGLSLQTLPASNRYSVVNELFLTGGMMMHPGAVGRAQSELRQLLPATLYANQPLRVRLAEDPILDAWRGAAAFARLGGEAFKDACTSRQEYEEMGPEYIREHMASNIYYPRPSDPERDSKRRKK